MLGQVLGRGLLGCPRTVEQLPLQEGQVGLATNTNTGEVSFYWAEGYKKTGRRRTI